MITLRATYKNGEVHFVDKTPPGESDNVLVTFVEDPETPKAQTAKEFLEKWAGAFKGLEVGDLKEERIRHIERKHR